MLEKLDAALAPDRTESQPEDPVGRRLRHLHIVPRPPAALVGAPSGPSSACGLKPPRWGLLGLHITDATNPGALN